MVSRSNIDMLLNVDERLQRPNCNLNEKVQGELEFMLQAQRNQRTIERERNLNVYRSGSAPPTVEGSLKAMRSLFGNNNFADFNDSVYSNGGVDNVALTEDDIRSHPAYLSYYYSHNNIINPRLPPPLLSKEDWQVAQRFHAGGGSSFRGIADLRGKVIDDNNGSSLFSMQPGPSVGQAEQDLVELRNAVRNNFARQGSVEWVDKGSDGLIGLQGSGLGTRRKSFADILQEGLDQPTSFSGLLSRPSSVNAFGEYVDPSGISELHPAALHNEVDFLEQQLYSRATLPCLTAVQDHNSNLSHSFSSAVGSSLSRSTTPDQQLIGRSLTPGLPPVGSRAGPVEKKNIVGGAIQNDHASGKNELGELAAKLSGLSMSNFRRENEDGYGQTQVKMNLNNEPDFTFSIPGVSKQSFHQHFIEKPDSKNYSHSTNFADMATNEVIANLNASKISPNVRQSIPKRTSSSVNLLSNAHAASIENFDTLEVHQNVNIPGSDFISHSSGAYSLNQSSVNSYLGAGGSGIGSNLHRVGNPGGLDLHPPMMDPRYTQYLQRTSNHRTRTAGSSSGPQIKNCFGTSSGELEGIDKAFIEALLAQQKQQYELSLLVKSGGSKEGYYKNPSPGFGMPYPRNSMLNSAGFRGFQNEQAAQLASLMKNSLGGPIASRHIDIGNKIEKKHMSSLLDEFKNKARSFELSDIVGHVVEFSTDQYGSRFIQQKLETAAVEEKNSIFPEIMPHARTLMTDVFGNYVIQKFFEHGTKSERVELASQLTGHVLPFSLQMYGCRVIQKALEVVDVDLQKQMMAELDGSVMKCVCDQNGNHVIQKCIECVPEDQIQFIISSFYGQVVALSMHPYGCRVIQRVLEHCRDTNTLEVIMDEIMQAVCILAQDQYGNYVIQHVLEHGKPQIRSAVISKLAGQIVKMSRQKFASNVVERCLTFGGPEERQILVNEMLGSTDENEPLQAMMKDPFGNYVVQKVLETCDDQSLQLILSRIRVHFNTLKRYTYGKHIVSRVEKLIAAGERRIGLSSSRTTSQAT